MTGLVIFAAVLGMSWGCASSTCHLDADLKMRLLDLERQTASLKKASETYGLYQQDDVIGREVTSIAREVSRLQEPDACEQVTQERVRVLERRIRAVDDAVLGNCLERASQKRQVLESLHVPGIQPVYPTGLEACLDRLDTLDQRLAGAGGLSEGRERPCPGEPATLDRVRQAVDTGDRAQLRRLASQAAARLENLSHELEGLIRQDPEPSEEQRRAMDKGLECAGSWILALGDTNGLERRFRDLRHRFEDLDAHRTFLRVAAGVVSEADTGVLNGLDTSGLEQRRQRLETVFGQLRAPAAFEEDLKATVIAAINRAEEDGFRKQAQLAITGCDQDRFQTALGGLRKLGAATADLEEQFQVTCVENVEELASRLKASLDEFHGAMGRDNIAAQDRAMESFLREAATVESLSPEGLRQLAQRVDLEAVEATKPCAQTLLEGDRALESGEISRVESAYRQAGELAGCPVGRLRKARLDVLRARRLWQRGDLESAWSLLSTAAGTLGGGARQDLARLAREGVRNSPVGSSQRLRWLRRLRGQVGLTGLAPAELLELATIASDQASSDPEVWQEAWDAISGFFGANPASPSLEDFVLAARVAHALDVSGRGWASGSWKSSSAEHIDQFVAWCNRYGPRLGAGMAARLKNLVGYQEVLYLASETLRSLWEEVQELGPSRRQQVRDTVLRGLLEAISTAPLVRKISIGASGHQTGEGPRQLVETAMRVGLAVSKDGRLVAASSATPFGRLVMVFDLTAAAGPSGGRTDTRDRLAIAQVEAMGTVAGILVEMTSGRTDLSIPERKAAVADIIEGLRYRMAANVLAYAGLFNRDGALEVPLRPSEFFLDRDLVRAGVPVFQDGISRRAVSSDSMKVQRYNLKGKSLADVAVPIRRGRNRIGVLRLGVTQSAGSQR